MADRAGNIAPERRTQGVILSETARRPSCGRRRLFRGKADRRNRCGTTRQAAPADMQAGIPRIQKPWSGPNGNGKRCGGGRRGTGDGQQTASAGRWTAQRATDNRRRGDGRRWAAMGGDGRRWAAMDGDGRRWTAMDGDGRRAKEVRNGGRKTRRNTDAGGRTDKAGELPAERATGRGSYGQRELRAEGATGRQEENVRQEGRQRKERCNEDRQDSGVRRQKKQACATAGPTTRPEGRHTIFISARPEYASQRRESSYRPA